MASQVYPKMREKFLHAQFSWMTGTFRCVLLPDGYNPNLADEFLSDVASSSRIAISQEILNRTATDGFASSDPIVFPLLVDSRSASKAIIYKDTGVDSTSELIFLMTDPQLVSVPFALQGFDYFIYPNAIEGGFFRL